jgi:hypothetical protein
MGNEELEETPPLFIAEKPNCLEVRLAKLLLYRSSLLTLSDTFFLL